MKITDDAVNAAAKGIWSYFEKSAASNSAAPSSEDLEVARAALEAAMPGVIAPALALADDWDAVADTFPSSAAGIFAKSHANRLREVLA